MKTAAVGGGVDSTEDLRENGQGYSSGSEVYELLGAIAFVLLYFQRKVLFGPGKVPLGFAA